MARPGRVLTSRRDEGEVKEGPHEDQWDWGSEALEDVRKQGRVPDRGWQGCRLRSHSRFYSFA